MRRSVKRGLSSAGSAALGAVVAVVLLGGAPAGAFSVPNNSVTSLKIVDGAVATVDLANNAVTSSKIAAGAVQTTDLSRVVRDRLTTGLVVVTESFDPAA